MSSSPVSSSFSGMIDRDDMRRADLTASRAFSISMTSVSSLSRFSPSSASSRFADLIASARSRALSAGRSLMSFSSSAIRACFAATSSFAVMRSAWSVT
jgi:hypothetical protein